MADEKKPEVKPAGSFFSHPDPFVEIVWTILALLVIFYVLNALVSGILSLFSGDYTLDQIIYNLRDILINILGYILKLKYLIWILCAVMAFFIVNLLSKLNYLRDVEKKALYPEISMTDKSDVNPQWERVLGHIESLNENDWRLAIIEADIMLADLLDKMSLPGDTIGDKLKAVEKSDFTTVDYAWEAHKVRNQIAHEGGAFKLNQHEAKRVVGLFEAVFKEFQII